MKKIFSLFLTFALLLASGACGNAAEDIPVVITNKTYQSYWLKQFDYKTMPIAAFNAVPPKKGEYPDNFITDQNYKTLSEAGFNTAYALYDTVNNYAEDVKDALSYCEKYNLSYLAGLDGAHEQKDSSVLESAIYKTLLQEEPKALGGVIIRDEPSRSEYENVAESQDIFRGLLPEKTLLHSNLYPTYATEEQLYNRNKGTPELPADGYGYARYVRDFVDICRPQVLSYDYYPLGAKEYSIDNGYFRNMSIIRKEAQQAEIPFWVYIQTCSFNGSVRIPTTTDLAWLVNSSLAYGSKGIQYFTYWIPLSGAETFNGAFIDINGNKTELYDSVKELNKHIATIDEVLMCSLSKGVMRSGTTPAAIPKNDIIERYGALSSVEGESMFVGCFDYNGRDAFYAVNNTVYPSSGEGKLKFDKNVSGYVIKNSVKSAFSEVNELPLTLASGEGALVVLNK